MLFSQRGFGALFLIIILIIIGAAALAYFVSSRPPSKTVESSIVIWSSKDPKKVVSGQTITGKGIPNSEVRVKISPSDFETKVKADQNGIWKYKLPSNLKTQKYKVSVSLLDRYGDKVFEKTYSMEVDEKKSLFDLGFGNLFNPSKVYAAEVVNTKFPADLYQSYGFPLPNGSFNNLTEGEIYRWREYYLPYAIIAEKYLGIDKGLLGMWVYHENYMSVYQDNCFDGNLGFDPLADLNQNTYCPGWYLLKGGSKIPNWQIGWGIYPYEAAEDFRDELSSIIRKLHPNETIQQIGQKVIEGSLRQDTYSEKHFIRFAAPYDGISNPANFPGDVSLDQIIEGSLPIGGDNPEVAQEAKDPNMRQLLGILLKDQVIGAYMLARHFKQVEIEHGGRIADDKGNWYKDAQNLQGSVNLIATLYSLSFDPNEVVLVDIDDASGDGEISAGERVNVTSICTRDEYAINPEYCSRNYSINNKEGRTFKFGDISVKAQNGEPDTLSEIKLLADGVDCAQTCTITIPPGTAPGEYNLIVYATKEGGQVIVDSDSETIKVSLGAEQAAVENGGNSGTAVVDPGCGERVDSATGGKASIPCYKIGTFDDNESLQATKDGATKALENYQLYTKVLSDINQTITDAQVKAASDKAAALLSEGQGSANVCVEQQQ